MNNYRTTSENIDSGLPVRTSSSSIDNNSDNTDKDSDNTDNEISDDKDNAEENNNFNENSSSNIKSNSKEKRNDNVGNVVGLVGSLIAVILAVGILALGLRAWKRRRASKKPEPSQPEVGELKEIVVKEQSPVDTGSQESNQIEGAGDITVVDVEKKNEIQDSGNAKQEFSQLFSVYTDKGDKTCQNLRLIGGRVRYRNKKTLAVFTCNEGANLVGTRNAVCTEGKWSAPTPNCIVNNCEEPTVNDTNIIKETFLNGGMMQFSCNPGFFRDGPERSYCMEKEWIPKPPICKAGVSQGCDFEVDLCGWSDDLTDQFDWSRNKGDTPTANTGPMFDHTTNSSEGYYLFIESSAPQKNGSYARFLSPFYKTESLRNKCLQFYYHMFGDENVGILEVFLRPKKIPTEALNSDHQIFYKKGNQGDNWIKANVIIPEITETSQIVFQATTRGWLSDIGLDDISITSCEQGNAIDNNVSDKSPVATQTVMNDVFDSPTTQAAITVKTSTTVKAGTKTTKATSTLRATTKLTKPETSVTLTTSMAPKTTIKQTTPGAKTSTAAKTVNVSTSAVKTTTSIKSTAASQTVQTTLRSSIPIRASTASTLSPSTKPTTVTMSTPKPTTAATEVRRAETSPTSSSPTTEILEATVSSQTTVEKTSSTLTTLSDMTSPTWKATSSPEEVASTFQPTQIPVGSEITSIKYYIGETTIDQHYTETTNEDSNRVDEDGDGVNDGKDVSDGEDIGDDNDDNEDTEPEETTSPIDESRDNDTSKDLFVDSNGDMDNDMLTPEDNAGNNAATGKVHSSEESSGTKELLPLIIGVVSAVLVGAVVIGILTWRWSKNQRMKQQKEEDDQMNIITEYVETTLNV
ncbi:hypothetical protein Btru_076221 [Bulinus truncatus]|nr:hypothetical protein Btru_076221 [Bulinus truncatus]